MDTLSQIQDVFKIIIHPVLPILDLTRSTVLLFNKILMKKLDERKNSLSVKYLPFFEQLLQTDGKLSKEYELDGTHINPSYLHLLEKSLNQLSH